MSLAAWAAIGAAAAAILMTGGPVRRTAPGVRAAMPGVLMPRVKPPTEIARTGPGGWRASNARPVRREDHGGLGTHAVRRRSRRVYAWSSPHRSRYRRRFSERAAPQRHAAAVQMASLSGRTAVQAQAVAWYDAGLWYEYSGCYPEAAAAYAEAARRRPSDSLTFDAGRALERAGDIEQAVEFYARVLSRQPDRQPQPAQHKPMGKGAWQWDVYRGSA